MQDFRNVKVWAKAHHFTLRLYELTKEFPKEELYGLTIQLRRASSSIPTNISEGCGRRTKSELGQFFQIAMGSASEVEYQLLLAKDLGYIQLDRYQSMRQEIEEIKKMLSSFIVKLRESVPNRNK